jgi:hypothetical protein
MRNFLLLVAGVCSPGILMAAIFSWTDSSGNLIYGDSPPQGVTAKPLTPPKLTVLEGFANRYEDPTEVKKAKTAKNKAVVKAPVATIYKELKIIAPKQGQGIRANDGDVSVALSFSPKLQQGDKIVFTLDGKELMQGVSKVANMTNLDRGEHILTVSIVSKSSKKLITSEELKFSVLRAIATKKKPFNPYETK